MTMTLEQFGEMLGAGVVIATAYAAVMELGVKKALDEIFDYVPRARKFNSLNPKYFKSMEEELMLTPEYEEIEY